LLNNVSYSKLGYDIDKILFIKVSIVRNPRLITLCYSPLMTHGNFEKNGHTNEQIIIWPMASIYLHLYYILLDQKIILYYFDKLFCFTYRPFRKFE